MKSEGGSDSSEAVLTKELVLSKGVASIGISIRFEPGITELLKRRFNLFVGT